MYLLAWLLAEKGANQGGPAANQEADCPVWCVNAVGKRNSTGSFREGVLDGKKDLS